MSRSTPAGLAGCIETIESTYEFMLAFAAQGVSGAAAESAGSEIRAYLKRADQAMRELAGLLNEAIESLAPPSAKPYRAFVTVVEGDTSHAQAAVQLVLAQPAISSQMIDNLNALIHLRALLTDLFLIEEILRPPKSAEGS
jgi:hypothetical protein